jgi:thiol:disulfide interchange protein DsbG
MRFLIFLTFLTILGGPAFAQGKSATMPDVPEALAALSERGAQLRYLGKEHGMDGWIAIYQGQEQYYYITADGKAFVTGLMFGQDGRPITIDQVRALQSQGGEFLDLLADDAEPKSLEEVKQETTVADVAKMKSPAERMFADVEKSNIVRLGSATAPVIYSFIDPQCPHCHDFIQGMRKDYIEKGLVQVRLIPVGFIKGSPEQASLLLASPDAEERFYKHLDGDKGALPAKEAVSTQAVQKNMAVMQAWKFDVTPLTVYRARNGEVKILRGMPKDIPGLIADLPTSSPPAGAQSIP